MSPASYGLGSAGIHKRTSMGSASSSRRNSGARLSGGSVTAPSSAPLSYYEEAVADQMPAWQRRGASRSGNTSKNSSGSGSRRNSKNLDGNVTPETPLLNMQTSTSSSSHPFDIPTPSGDMKYGIHNEQYNGQQPNLSMQRELQRKDDLVFSLDPLLQALTPASAPSMSHTLSFDYPSTFATASASILTPPSDAIAADHASTSLRPRSSSKTSFASLTAAPGSRRESKLRSANGIAERGRSNSPRRLSRGPSLSRAIHHGMPDPEEDDASPLAKLKARGVDASTLLRRIRASRDGAGKGILLLDIRPLQVFVGKTEGRLHGSVNVNFPSLLVKRFRKGSTASFALESFVTTQTGHRIYAAMCPGGDLMTKCLDLDVCILDTQITDKDFGNLQNSGSTGAVLVTLLEQRRLAAGRNQDVEVGDLWYLQVAMSSMLKEAEDVPGLVAAGPDDNDRISLPAPTSPFTENPPSKPLPTSSLAATKLTHSISDDALERVSLAKQKARNLPHLSLPASTVPAPSIPKAVMGSIPPSPGLFRSQSDSQTVPGRQGNGYQRRPVQLEKIDTSVRQQLIGLEESRHDSQQRDMALKGKRRAPPPPSLAPPRSFQEVCMEQASTPTRAAVASAAGAGLDNAANVTNGSDDYASGPPLTPSRTDFRHPQKITTDSNGSNAYPSLHQPRNGYRGAAQVEMPAEPNNCVVPFSVSIIIPGFLYLGPEPVKESDAEDLESIGIRRILNMAIECDTQERWKNRFEKIATIPMRDSLAEVNVQDKIREACVLLDDADLHGRPTFVHCKAGKSRSVTIVLAYLIHRCVAYLSVPLAVALLTVILVWVRNHWPLKRAYAHVSERRSGVSPNIGFVAELMRFEENELGSRSQGVIGSGNTPSSEQGEKSNSRNGYFRSHNKTSSNASDASTASTTSNSRTPVSEDQSPNLTRDDSASKIPTSTVGRPTIVRHLSLIANTAMNLSADQAGSKSIKDAKTAARHAKIRESLPPGVGFAGLGMAPGTDKEDGDAEHPARPRYTRTYVWLVRRCLYCVLTFNNSRSRTGADSARAIFDPDQD